MTDSFRMGLAPFLLTGLLLFVCATPSLGLERTARFLKGEVRTKSLDRSELLSGRRWVEVCVCACVRVRVCVRARACTHSLACKPSQNSVLVFLHVCVHARLNTQRAERRKSDPLRHRSKIQVVG